MWFFDFLKQYWLDIIALFWFFTSWLGYTYFARKKARTTDCIASVLHSHRKKWMASMLIRDNRIPDAALLTSLERNASFLASTSILVIAGIVTSLASISTLYDMIIVLPASDKSTTPFILELKLLLVLLIHIYSFFTFTWAMRQYGFCAVLLGAAPPVGQINVHSADGLSYIKHLAKVIDLAGHSYNYGLRAFYFSLAVLAWLINIWLFLLAVAYVVFVLYLREFHSPVLKSLIGANGVNQR